MKPLVTAALAGVLLAVPCPAAAHEPAEDVSDAGRASPETPIRPELGYWSRGAPRFFVSSRSELGLPYAKPYVSLGYGMPHWIWTGIDLNAIATPEFVQGYAGVRAASPVLDLAFGARDTFSFDKPFLAPAASFDDDDLELHDRHQRSRYWAIEAEAIAIVPLPHSALVGNFIVVRTLDVPEDFFVYDESYRVITADPTFFVLRMAAVARFGNEDAIKLGGLVEHLFGTGRGKGAWRVGPAGLVQLTDHLEIVAALTMTVSDPDALGFALGAYGVAGLRYRWATGEPDPKLPWRGPLIP